MERREIPLLRLTEEQLSGLILGTMVHRPCACGKRQFADQQEIVEGPVIQHDHFDGGCTVCCTMRCQVCNDVHKGSIFSAAEIEVANGQ